MNQENISKHWTKNKEIWIKQRSQPRKKLKRKKSKLILKDKSCWANKNKWMN